MGLGGQRHAPAALSPGKNRYPLYRRLGGSHGWSGRGRKFSPLPAYDPRTAQPVASCIHRLSYPGQQSPNAEAFFASGIFYCAVPFCEIFYCVSCLYVQTYYVLCMVRKHNLVNIL